MSHQELYDDEENGTSILPSCILEGYGADLGLQKLEEVMNNKTASYTTKIESLIQVWQKVSECHIEDHGDYVIRLMDWLKRHTLNIVLNGDWKAKKSQYEEVLLDVINNCETYLANANNIYSLRCRKLAEVIKDPWGNPYLIRILSGEDKSVGDDVFEFFRMETGHLLSTRLKQLCESHCEDLALNLLTVFIECHRLSEVQNFSLNASLNQIRYCYDVYIALLFKFKRYDDIIATVRCMSLGEGLELMTRFAKKCVSALKIWKHSRQIAHLIGTEYVREILAKPPENSVETLEAFLEIWLSVTNLSGERLVKLFKDNIRKILLAAESAILLYPFCEMIYKKFGKDMKTFVIELYIRALTTDMNTMEREKNENETDKMTATAERLAIGFLRLADVLDEHVKVSRECALTSFSLVPTRASFNKIIALAVRSGCESIDSWKCKYHPPADMSGGELSPCKECGEYISEVKKTPVNINTALSEALTAEELGLGPQLCDDLVVLLSCPRYQFLNWIVPWRDLYRLCVIYLDDAEGTRNFVKDLKFVEIDYSLLPPIKRSLVDNDGPIYEPYLSDYLNWEEPASDTQDLPFHTDTDRSSLQPYCSKSNPEVVKILRQFRRTNKRSKLTPLENEPPEKVYLPSSSAPSTSSTCSDSCSDCSDKPNDFFVPFYYYVNNYHKRTKLVPHKKKHKTTASSSNSVHTAISCSASLHEGSTQKNVDKCAPIDFSITSPSKNYTTPIDYSRTSQLLTHSECTQSKGGQFRENLNSSNNSSSFSSEFEKLIFSRKSLVDSDTVNSDINPSFLPRSSKQSSISSNSFLDNSSVQKNSNKRLGKSSNNNSTVTSSSESSIPQHGCVKDNMDVITISDSDSDSELEMIELGTCLIKNRGNTLSGKCQFYREVPFTDVYIKSEPGVDIKCENVESADSETNQNFHLGVKNTDSPEKNSNRSLNSDNWVKRQNVIIDHNAAEEEIINSSNSCGDSGMLVDPHKEIETITKTNMPSIHCVAADDATVDDTSYICKFQTVLETTILNSSQDCSEKFPNNRSDVKSMALQYVCNTCKQKLKLLDNNPNDTDSDRQFFSLATDCLTNGHITLNACTSTTVNNTSNSTKFKNEIDSVCCSRDIPENINQNNKIVDVSKNAKAEAMLDLPNDTKHPLNQISKHICEHETDNCDNVLNPPLDTCIEQMEESCDISKELSVVSSPKSPSNCDLIDLTNSSENFSKNQDSSQLAHSRTPTPETDVKYENNNTHINNISDFENISNLASEKPTVGCKLSSTSRRKKKKFIHLKKKYYTRHSSVIVNKLSGRALRKRKSGTSCLCCKSPVKHDSNTKIAKSENNQKQKANTGKLIKLFKVGSETYNKTSPLQDINPKVYSRSGNLKTNLAAKQQQPEGAVSFCFVNRLQVDQNNKQDNTNSTLLNVPGLHDLQMIKPSSVDRIVQVIQIPGSRCATNITVPANMTQISPHIQRIGQPRLEKLDCTSLASSPMTTDSTVSTTPATINIISQPSSRPTNNSKNRRSIPAVNLLSHIAKAPPGNTSDSQVNNIPRVITSGEQILNQLINPDGTSTQALRNLVGSTGSDQNRIVQLICKASDGKLIPVTSFTSNKVVKLSMTQTVNSQVTGNATGSEENVTKFSQTTTKIKAELMENSEILPKFQQAFGKPAYQNCVNVTECITVNNDRDETSEVGKTNVIKAQPKNLNASINVQPVQGGVIYARQVPVGQSINIIPPARGQILRIATSSTEELSLVKETVIQGKMTALLAAALQSNKQKNLNSNELSINSEEFSQTSTHVALTACPTLVQNARIVKPIIQIPSNMIRNSPQCNLSSTTLEQLREFDMVYNQVKERSDTGTITDTNAQSDSSEETQHVSVTYLNQGQKINCAPVVVVSNYCNVQPASSPSLSITSQGSSSPSVTTVSAPIIAKLPMKTRPRILKNPISQLTKTSPIPKPQQKPQEDEQTTQRIFDILAEYAEQLRNSPDLNNKPAPRRRSNPPTNPNQNSKRKKSSGSKKIEQSSNSVDVDLEDAHTIGSEDSSCGVIQLSVPDDDQPSVEISESSLLQKQIILTDNVTNQHHNLIITDSSVGEALKVSGTAVLVPGNYIMPVSMMKGSQQIVVSGGSKILATVPARSGSNMLLFQSFLNQTHKPVLSTVKCSTLQPLIDLSQHTLTTEQTSIDVLASPAASVTLTNAAARTSAIIDTDTDREVFLTIPDPLENKKVSHEHIRKVYHNNLHHKRVEVKEGSLPYVENVNDIQVDSSTQEEDLVPNTILASTTSSPVSQNNGSVTTVSAAVATSVITHINNELNGFKGADQKSGIACRILSSGDYIKDNEIQMEGRIKSVLVATGTANGFSFPHVTATTCSKQADATISIAHLNKDMCDDGKVVKVFRFLIDT